MNYLLGNLLVSLKICQFAILTSFLNIIFFLADSNTGKRLMAKCRLLYQENEDLGKMTSNGRLSMLQSDIALQKSFSEEVKKSQSGIYYYYIPHDGCCPNFIFVSELDDFLQELDEDVEGMQSTIFFLQQELKIAKENISVMERENLNLRLINNPQDGGNYNKEVNESPKPINRCSNTHDFEDENSEKHMKKRGYNSDSSGNNSMDIEKSIKKSRRSSVLSLDLNEEDDIDNEVSDKLK